MSEFVGGSEWWHIKPEVFSVASDEVREELLRLCRNLGAASREANEMRDGVREYEEIFPVYEDLVECIGEADALADECDLLARRLGMGGATTLPYRRSRKMVWGGEPHHSKYPWRTRSVSDG